MKNKTLKNKKFRYSNCGPIKRNKTKKNSCLDDKSIIYLKNVYNEHNKQHKITSNNPKKIWVELKKNIHECNNEQCWLKFINNKKIVDKINKIYFAPKQPLTWKKNPNMWLYDRDIFNVLKQYEIEYPSFRFIGPTPIDFDSSIDIFHNCVTQEMCDFSLENYLHNKINKIGIIFNLDKHYESGSHWTSLFIDLTDNFIYYMDSVGNTYPNEVDVFIKRIISENKKLNRKDFKLYVNSVEHQKGDSECGMYSLYFIITLLTEKVNNKKFKSYDDKIKYFSKKRITDNFIFQYRDKYFNK